MHFMMENIHMMIYHISKIKEKVINNKDNFDYNKENIYSISIISKIK